ncbi:DUF4129 domain-containing protein [Actinomadura craniellae]|uniref:DUF4129 domain-containing protein n=2 Tax=Actinomadura craniellae TaxID=2231787 RepID=A0A365H674_9ACTN|nr:DUF4129 domain-containing protein [Actinomadura craniellae]
MIISAPEPIARDPARELAERELEKPIYHRDDPSLLEQIWQRFSEWLRDLFNRVPDPQAQGAGGGIFSWVIVALVVIIAVGLVAWVMRGRRNTRSERAALLDEQPSTALDHRAAAERHALAGEWAEAIRERLRAIARDLEERAILPARPGRTADELAGEAGTELPDHADELRACVLIFDDVWYGDRPGTEAGYARLTALDTALRSARPRPLPQPEAVS